MLTAAAGRQLHQARTWWLENRDKAPEAFDEELLVLFDILETGSSTLGDEVSEQELRDCGLDEVSQLVRDATTDTYGRAVLELALDGDGRATLTREGEPVAGPRPIRELPCSLPTPPTAFGCE